MQNVGAGDGMGEIDGKGDGSGKGIPVGAGDGTIVGCAVQSQGKAQPLGSVSTSELLTSPAGHSRMQSHESWHQHLLDPSSVTPTSGQKSALMMVVFGNWFTQPS